MEQIFRLSGLPGVSAYTATFYVIDGSFPPQVLPLIETEPGDYEGAIALADGSYVIIFENAGREVARTDYVQGIPTSLPPAASDLYEILRFLGYGNPDYDRHALYTLQTISGRALHPSDVLRVSEIRQTLAVLDEQISQAIGDSAITDACGSKMDWTGHLKLLRSQAQYLLEELANIYGIELLRSPYQNQAKQNYIVDYV